MNIQPTSTPPKFPQISKPSENISNETRAQSSRGTEKNDSKETPIQVIKETLNSEELENIQNLKLRDREVRTHEAAHLAAAGQYATSGAKFQYERGPDGKNYAVGGEVSIDTSAIPNDPEATLKKAQQIQAAARAPSEPSSQDRQVAAEATKMATEAKIEIIDQRQTSNKSNSSTAEKDAEPTNSQSTRNNSNSAITTYTDTNKLGSEEKNSYLNFFV